MTLWNSHQKRLRALRELAYYERTTWSTRRRRTPSEARINTMARTAWARAYFALQDFASQF